jgi:hypothetical protein
MLPRKGVLYKPLRPSQIIEIAAAYSKSAIFPALSAFLKILRKNVPESAAEAAEPSYRMQ